MGYLKTSALIAMLAAGSTAGFADDRWERRDRDYRWERRDRDDRYERRGNRGWNRDRYYGRSDDWQQRAYSQGMQDGRFDGQRDRATGHSFRPTKSGNYKHADRGYSSGFGEKDLYKQSYRNGYLSGYEQGYRW